MSYEYANTSFATPLQASRAAVSDYLYSSGKNSVESVADMARQPVAEIVAEIKSVGWEVPHLDEHTATIEQLVNEVICDAQAESLAQRDD